MKRYRTNPGLILRVGPTTVTDAPEGTPLPESRSVREHVRLGRLVPVAPTPLKPMSKRRNSKEESANG